jgi:hypothetical protein
VSGRAHVGFLDAVEQILLPIEDHQMSLVHGLGSLLVVAAANQKQLGLVAHLDALVVVRQGYLKVVDTVVQLEPDHSVDGPVILKNVLGILLQNVNVARKTRVIVLHDRHCILVGCHNFLDLLCRDHVVSPNAITSLNMLKNCTVAFSLTATWAIKVEKL